MFLMIDNYDSFTYNLVQYFSEMIDVKVVRNDEVSIEDIQQLKPQAIILSPGPSNPNDAGICLQVVSAFKGVIPIFGVCLGHQIIAQAYGANVIKGTAPVHGKSFDIEHDGLGVFQHIASPTKVGRYHSLVVDESTLPPNLKVTAKTADGVVMAMRDEVHQIETVQFHPESVLTPYGKLMVQNFVKGVL